MEIKYPEIVVKLVGEDGNVFYILGRVQQAMRRAEIPTKDIDLFMDEAMSGDYDHALQTALRWVTVE